MNAILLFSIHRQINIFQVSKFKNEKLLAKNIPIQLMSPLQYICLNYKSDIFKKLNI